MKKYYTIFQEDLNSNQIYLKDDKKVYVGPYNPGARPVNMRQEKSSQEFIADAKKLRYLILPTLEVRTLKIEKLLPNPYFTNEKDDYISLDTLLDISVSAACSSQNKGNSSLAKKLIRKILHK